MPALGLRARIWMRLCLGMRLCPGMRLESTPCQCLHLPAAALVTVRLGVLSILPTALCQEAGHAHARKARDQRAYPAAVHTQSLVHTWSQCHEQRALAPSSPAAAWLCAGAVSHGKHSACSIPHTPVPRVAWGGQQAAARARAQTGKDFSSMPTPQLRSKGNATRVTQRDSNRAETSEVSSVRTSGAWQHNLPQLQARRGTTCARQLSTMENAGWFRGPGSTLWAEPASVSPAQRSSTESRGTARNAASATQHQGACEGASQQFLCLEYQPLWVQGRCQPPRV